MSGGTKLPGQKGYPDICPPGQKCPGNSVPGHKIPGLVSTHLKSAFHDFLTDNLQIVFPNSLVTGVGHSNGRIGSYSVSVS